MGRRFPRWNEDGIGCKGGTSPNAGKKSATYQWTATEEVTDDHFGHKLAAGTTIKARSFVISDATCKAYVFATREGKWILNLCDGSWSRDKPHVYAERVK